MPLVFISHSSRERHAAELDDDDTPEQHAARKVHLDEIKRMLVEALRSKGLSVWIDDERLRAGHEFDEPIQLAVGRCDVGVVLIDRDAVTSEYVRTETTLLMYRRSLGAAEVVPVMLRSAQGRLRGSLLGDTLGFSKLSAIQEPKARDQAFARAQLVELIADRVAEVRSPADATAEDSWTEWFAHTISTVPRALLTPVAAELGIESGQWDRVEHPHRALATLLLGAPLASIQRALVLLAQALRHDPAARGAMIGHAMPLWVDLDDARALREITALDADARTCAVATSAVRLGRNVVERAMLTAPAEISDPPDVTGEDHQGELLERYSATLRALLHMAPDEDTDGARRFFDETGQLAFALVRFPGSQPAEARRLLSDLAAAFPGVVFVVLAASSRQHRSLGVPALGPLEDTERAARRYVSQLARLNGDTIQVDSDE